MGFANHEQPVLNDAFQFLIDDCFFFCSTINPTYRILPPVLLVADIYKAELSHFTLSSYPLSSIATKRSAASGEHYISGQSGPDPSHIFSQL